MKKSKMDDYNDCCNDNISYDKYKCDDESEDFQNEVNMNFRMNAVKNIEDIMNKREEEFI
jgi:hypothetical protein